MGSFTLIKNVCVESKMDVELFEEEIEIYNSKMRLLNWLYEEIKLQPSSLREGLKIQGLELPINL
jgi:hypothetical protein